MNKLIHLLSARTLALLAGSIIALGAPHARVACADEPDARERRAFDADSGRNLLNFPPHRVVEVRHMRLQLRIPNMNERSMLASETLTLAPIAAEVGSFSLNAALLQVASVSCPNRTCTFARNDADETLDIQINPPLGKGQTADITINYRVTDAPIGLMWTTETPQFPGRPAQIHTQGEAEMNRYWFAGQDFPNARCTSELIVTVPRGFQVVSNGKLESVTHEKLEPYDTFHWMQDKPHAAYLVSMIVGKFDVVDVGSSSLPMPVYVPVGQGDRVRATFGRTPHMVEVISRLTGQPYPWAKYAQTSVYSFWWGGMENTSATTLFETVALDKTALLDGDQDDLIVHELAHQWFGDYLTCRSWEHIWLNEGFATYVEGLWVQYKDASLSSGRGTDGLKADNDAYLATIWGWQQDVIKNDTGAAPYQPAMASKEYDSPDDVFDRAANPYPKGALLLHMLRQKMGDAVFFRGINEYIKTNALKPVETFQFRHAMEKVSGLSLQRFFDQWAFRPLTPKILATPTWDAANGTLNISFEQTQTVDGYNPAFDVSIPVWVKSKGQSSWTKLAASFDTRTYTLSAKLAAEPEMVVVDPELAVLADMAVRQDAKEWAQQLAAGPTMGSRLRATLALGHADDAAAATAALNKVVRDERAMRELRIAAAKALGELGDTGARALSSMLDAGIADARVRSQIAESAANAAKKSDAAAKDALADRLSKMSAADPAYGARAAAVKGLGLLNSDHGWAAVAAALDTESQHDQIRRAAVGALAEMDRADGLPLVLKRVALGNASTLRPDAVDAIGKLAHHDPARVFATLAGLLDDPEPKTVNSAGKAIAAIGGAKARTLLEGRLPGLTSRFWKAKTQEWIRDIKPEKAESASR